MFRLVIILVVLMYALCGILIFHDPKYDTRVYVISKPDTILELRHCLFSKIEIGIEQLIRNHETPPKRGLTILWGGHIEINPIRLEEKKIILSLTTQKQQIHLLHKDFYVILLI